MSADKTRASVLADKLDAMRDVDFDSVFVPAAAELRRIPALEAELKSEKSRFTACYSSLCVTEAERDQLREQLETLKERFREAAADAVESMPAGLLTCDATGSASDSYVAQWKAAEVLRNLDL